MSKRRLIKDPIWGNIELFSWETQLVNHFIFNRLHNIVQNSSAYRAYPGLKYSRFLHTIGVAHVATQLFTNSLINAEQDAIEPFAAEAELAAGCLVGSLAEIEVEICHRCNCPQAFAPLLAILRTAALLHDVGHLPFSHVFENALDSFLQVGLEKTIAIEHHASRWRDSLIALSIESADDDDHEPTKLHERLGVMLARTLEREMSGGVGAGLIREARKLLGGAAYPIATTFIKGTIDADRIDFIKRDGAFSGLFTSSVDYDRLFKLYTLEGDKTDGVTKNVIARPSARAVSESEKLLWERFQDYKYIVVHHKVHLYDEVVENILVRMMATGHLNGLLENLSNLSDQHGISAFSGGRSTVKETKQRFEFLLSVLLAFDDPWVESQIRGLYKAFINGERTDPMVKSIEPLFQVYIEDRERYRSVFKSDLEFWSACSLYAPSLSRFRPHDAASDTHNERVYCFRALYAAKFALQQHLQDLGLPILIGPTDKKVSYGVRNDDLAQFYGVEELVSFLKAKKYGTMLFNCWYDVSCRLQVEEVRAAVLPVIATFFETAANNMNGIIPLPLDR